MKGSPENLKRNFKEIVPSVRQNIDSEVANGTQLNDTNINNFVITQMQSIQKSKNPAISDDKLIKVVQPCIRRGGIYVGQTQAYADNCRVQLYATKRIKKYIIAANEYKKNRTQLDIKFENSYSYAYYKFKILCMQHFAKRAYLETDGGVKGLFSDAYPNNGTTYFNWFKENIDKMANKQADEYKSLIARAAKNYIWNRYVSGAFKLKLTKVEDKTPASWTSYDAYDKDLDFKNEFNPSTNVGYCWQKQNGGWPSLSFGFNPTAPPSAPATKPPSAQVTTSSSAQVTTSSSAPAQVTAHSTVDLIKCMDVDEVEDMVNKVITGEVYMIKAIVNLEKAAETVATQNVNSSTDSSLRK